MPVRVTRFCDLVALLKALAVATDKPIRIFPIGTQGSGKSTLGERLQQALRDAAAREPDDEADAGPGGEAAATPSVPRGPFTVEVISPDKLRLDWYQARHPGEPRDYRRLRRFLSIPRQRRVNEMIRWTFEESDARFVYLDRMNLTAAQRAPFLSPANFNVAVVLRPGLATVLERHRRRPDKAQVIPDWVVAAGYRKLEMPTERGGGGGEPGNNGGGSSEAGDGEGGASDAGEFDLVVFYEPEEQGNNQPARIL